MVDDITKKSENTNEEHVVTDEDVQLAKLESNDLNDEPVTNQYSSQPVEQPATQEPVSSAPEPYISAAVLRAKGIDPNALPDTQKSRRFLIAYMTSVFSALAILGGVTILGYALFDHFLGSKDDESAWYYFDLAPVYLSLMASLVVFAVVYIFASRYVTKSASEDTIGLKDWRAYKVVYALFTALLVVTGASLIASLIYIPLAQLLIADDLESKQILVQVLGGLHVLVWIALLIWQERLVKKGKQSWLQGGVVVAGIAVIVVVTGIFPIGGKIDDRYDHRTENDLSTIESKISDYTYDNKQSLPASLSALKFGDDATIKNRLTRYEYKEKETPKSVSAADSLKKMQQTASLYSADTTDATSAENSLATDDTSQTSAETESADTSDSTSNSLYQTPAAKQYELCATFKTDTTQKVDSDSSSILTEALTGTSSSKTAGSDPFTRHKSGRVCFTRE